MRVKKPFLKRAAQIFGRFAALSIVFCCLISGANAQRGKTAKAANWSGTWTRAARNQNATIEIKMLPGSRFKFELNAFFGANDGAVAGVAEISGDTARFDDRKSPDKDITPTGCKLTFVNKNGRLKVSETAECEGYGGVGVVFGGDYAKGAAAHLAPETLVERGVLPNARIDRAFKMLVGKDYERFLNVLQIVSDDENLDDFDAKTISGCIYGICPFETGIIMHNSAGKIWAASTVYTSDDKIAVRYYTNDQNWTDKLPATIEKWRRSLLSDAPVIYRSKRAEK